jgi:single-strand DNA-binding protein
MGKLFDVVATTGTYEKDGEKKYLNKNIGAVILDRNGKHRLTLDSSFNLAALDKDEQGKVWLALFEARQQGQQPPATAQSSGNYAKTKSQPMPDNFDEDECPF